MVPENIPGRQYIYYGLVVAVGFLGTLGYRLSVPVVAFRVRDVLGASALIIGGLSTSYFIGRALFAVVAGKSIGRMRNFILLPVIGLFLNSLLVLSYGFIGASWQALLIRFGQGVAAGLLWIPLQYLVAAYVPVKWRGRAYSIYFSMSGLGVFAANTLYALLVGLGDWLILVLASLVLASCIPLVLILPPARSEDRVARDRVSGGSGRGVGGWSGIVWFTILSGFSLNFVLSIAGGDLPYIFINEIVGLSKPDTALLLSAVSILGMIIGFGASWIADRYSDRRVLLTLVLLMPLSLILIALLTPLTVLLGFVLLRVIRSTFTPVSRRILSIYHREPGAAIGYINMASNIGVASGSLYTGYFYDLLGFENIAVWLLVFNLIPLTLLPVAIIPVAAYVLLLHGSGGSRRVP